MRAWPTLFGQASSCSRAERTCWVSATRTCSAIAPSRAQAISASGWWIGDHRREVRLGGELAVDACSPRKLADAGALLDKFDLELEQHARLHRLTELRAVNGHEVDELAGAGEAERLHREHARGLR